MTSPWDELKALAERIDVKRIAALAKSVDLVKWIGVLTQLEPEELAQNETIRKHENAQASAEKERPNAQLDFEQARDLVQRLPAIRTQSRNRHIISSHNKVPEEGFEPPT